MRSIVLYSGGPDSLITYEWARRSRSDVEPVYFALGHRYEAQEILAIQRTVKETKVHRPLGLLGFEWERGDAYIPHRNAFLALAASALLPEGEAGVIYLTVQKDELELADRSLAFLDDMTVLLTRLRGSFSTIVTTPWAGVDKTGMVEWWIGAGLPVGRLCETRSCYASEVMQCGACPACIRRFIAFSLNGIEEEYAVDPRLTPLADEYRRRAVTGHYSPERCERTLMALGQPRPDGSL